MEGLSDRLFAMRENRGADLRPPDRRRIHRCEGEAGSHGRTARTVHPLRNAEGPARLCRRADRKHSTSLRRTDAPVVRFFESKRGKGDRHLLCNDQRCVGARLRAVPAKGACPLFPADNGDLIDKHDRAGIGSRTRALGASGPLVGSASGRGVGRRHPRRRRPHAGLGRRRGQRRTGDRHRSRSGRH